MTMHRLIQFIVLAASTWMPAAGCGGDDAGSPASRGSDTNSSGGSAPTGTGASSPETGAPTLGGLTSAEATALCEETSSAELLQVRAASCSVTALREATMAEALGEDPVVTCQTEYEACVAQPVAPADCSGASAAFAGCSATLDEYDQCQVESAAAWDALLSSLGCENYTPDLLRQDPDTGVLPTCAAIDEKCPGALDAAAGGA